MREHPYHPGAPPLLWNDVEAMEAALARALREVLGEATFMAHEAAILRAIRCQIGVPLAARFFPWRLLARRGEP